MLAALLCVALACACALAQSANPYCGAPLPVSVPAPAGWSIVQASLITRHGARAPANVLPNEDVAWYCTNTDVVELTNPPIADLASLERNSYISAQNGFNAQIWQGNCTVGQLTALGASQHYQMGQQLRIIYVDGLKLLGEYFNPADVYIRSLDVWRGQQSAEANLLGLYPFAQRRGEVPEVNIMPAPIETMGTSACAEAAYLYASQMQTQQWAQAQAKMAPLYEKLNSVCGTGSNPAWNGSMGIDHFFDALLSRTCQGLPLPCSNGVCIDTSDVSAVQSEGNFEYNFLRAAPGYAQASVGAFVQEFTAHMAAATQKQPGPKFSFYSADDNTVGGLLAGFGITDGTWPPFAANLIFETWTNGTAYFVRALYNGAAKTLPACGSVWCPWTAFNAAASNLFVTFKECTPSELKPETRNPALPHRRHLSK